MNHDKIFTCFLVGETSLLIRCAAHLLAKGHRLAGIFSPDAEVNDWAKQQGVTCFAKQQDLQETLQKETFDYLFSVVNSWIIRPNPTLRKTENNPRAKA